MHFRPPYTQASKRRKLHHICRWASNKNLLQTIHTSSKRANSWSTRGQEPRSELSVQGLSKWMWPPYRNQSTSFVLKATQSIFSSLILSRTTPANQKRCIPHFYVRKAWISKHKLLKESENRAYFPKRIVEAHICIKMRTYLPCIWTAVSKISVLIISFKNFNSFILSLHQYQTWDSHSSSLQLLQWSAPLPLLAP